MSKGRERSRALIAPEPSSDEMAREKSKARELRRSQWWKRKRSTGKCFYCDKPFNPRDLTMDHVVPIVRGGRSTKGNVVAACKECNNQKKHLLPMEWQEYLDTARFHEEL